MSYQTKKEEKRRLNKLYHKTHFSYARGAWYDEEKQRVVRYYNPSIFKYWCRVGNRKFRHKHKDLSCGGNAYIKYGGSAWYKTW